MVLCYKKLQLKPRRLRDWGIARVHPPRARCTVDAEDPMWEFPMKTRIPCFGVLIIRILLVGLLY